MVDPRRLRVLLAVATHGSVGAAAAALHLTAPAVSQQLLALERETGAALIDRSGRHVSLTAAGRLLARHAERVTAQIREAERDLAQLLGHTSGPVRIAAFQSVMSDLIAPALRRLAGHHPSIQPSVTERYGPPAVTALRQGDLEIVLTEYDSAAEPPTESGVGSRPMIFDPYLLVTPQDWAVTVNSLADIAGRPWVAGPPGTACDQALHRLMSEAGVTQSPSDVCIEFPSVLALVAAGRGASIVPRMALTNSPVTTHSLPALGGRHIAALYQTTAGQPAPATRTVLDVLSETAKTLTATPRTGQLNHGRYGREP